MSSSQANLLKKDSSKPDIPSKEKDTGAPDWHKELALAEKPASAAKQNNDKAGDLPKHTEDGKTDFKTGNFHVTSKDGIYTVEEKIDGKIQGTLIYDANTHRGQVFDEHGKLLYKVNGKKGYLEHLISNNTSIFQLSKENLDLKQLGAINDELGLKPLEPSEQRLIVNPSGDMAVFKKGESEKDADIKVLIHKVESSDKTSKSVYFIVNDSKFELNKGKIYNVLGGDQPGSNGSRMDEFTKWNADGSYDFLNKSGKSIVKMYKDGKLSIGSTEVNLINSQISTVGNEGTVKTYLEKGKIFVDRPQVAKFFVDTDGVMENLSSHKGVFVNYKPNLGLKGFVDNGASYVIGRDRMQIADHRGLVTTINNNGSFFTKNAQNRLLASFGAVSDKVPGGLAAFEDKDSDDESVTGTDGKKHSGRSSINMGAIDAVVASLPAITVENFNSQRGLIAELSIVLSSAAQRASSDGNLAMATLCSRSLSTVLAAGDLLARKVA